MDLKQLDSRPAAEEGRFLHLNGPGSNGKPLFTDPDENGEKKPIGFILAGARSANFKAREAAMQKRRLADVNIGRRKQNIDIDAIAEDQKQLYASAVLEAHGIVYNGKAMQEHPTQAEVVALFEALPWVQAQVQEFIDDEANWLGN